MYEASAKTITILEIPNVSTAYRRNNTGYFSKAYLLWLDTASPGDGYKSTTMSG